MRNTLSIKNLTNSGLKRFYSAQTTPIATPTLKPTETTQKHAPLATPVPTPKLEPTYKDVKAALLKTNIVTKSFYLIAIVGTVATLIYYFSEKKVSPEEQLKMALEELRDSNRQIKQDGFTHLQSLYTTKRLFSGAVDLAISLNIFTSPEVITTLYSNIGSEYPEISNQSLTWLIKLLRYEKDEHTNSKVASSIFSADPQLSQLSRDVLAFDNKSHNTNWLLASHLLLNLPRGSQIGDRETISAAVNKLLLSNDPVAMITGSQLFEAYFTQIDLSVEGKEVFSTIQKSQSHQLLKIETTDLVPRTHTQNLGATIPSIIAFSAFAAIWGKVAWFLALHTSGAYSRAIVGADRAVVKQWSKKFLLKRRVGGAVFSIMMFDYLASMGLQHFSQYPEDIPKEPPFLRDNFSIVYPATQVTVLGLATVSAIKYHRFVMLPLMLALAYNHRDILSEKFPYLFPAQTANWNAADCVKEYIPHAVSVAQQLSSKNNKY